MNRPANLTRRILETLVLTLAGLAGVAAAEPVTDVSPNRIFLRREGHLVKIPYYRNHALGTPHATATRAVVVIHGADRAALWNYDGMVLAATDAGLLGTTMVFAPHFLTEEDLDAHGLAEDVLFWSSTGWKSGDESRTTAAHPRPVRLTSYEVLDLVVECLLDRSAYPALEEIVIAGHSAGGQLVNRYAAVTTVEPAASAAGVAMRFVVANPSSYLYLSTERPVAGTTATFAVPSASQRAACPDYNDYIYGLSDRFGYAAGVTATQIRNQYDERSVSYLLGEEDSSGCAEALDLGCEALLEGANRLERGLLYHRYLGHYYGSDVYTRHTLETVPDAGHGSRGMWRSAAGLRHIFDVAPAVLRAPTPLSPLGAELHTDFTWVGTYGATWYRVRVTDEDGTLTSALVKAADAGCRHGGLCAYSVPSAVEGSAARWSVRAYYGALGWGLTSSEVDFWDGMPDPPTDLVRPGGRVDDSNPTFEWKTVAGGAWYFLRVTDGAGHSYGDWYRASDTCNQTSCCVAPDYPLASGAATWAVRAWNHDGTSAESMERGFTVP